MMTEFFILLEGVVAQIAAVSLAASIVILLLLVAGPLLRKHFRIKWLHFAWLAIALRLVIPFQASLPQAPIQLEIPQRTVYSINTAEPEEQKPAPILTENDSFVSPAESSGMVPYDSDSYSLPPDVSFLPLSGTHSITLMQILACVWLMVTLFLFARYFTGYVFFLRRLHRWGKRETNHEILSMLDTLRKELHIHRKVGIIRLADINSPMLTGFFRPVLILPKEMKPIVLETILRHELTHCRHLDVWFQLLLTAAKAIHWFNPLVWLMAREASNTLELFCDESVTRKRDDAYRRDYCEAILETANGKHKHASAFSTAFRGGKKSLKQRFSSILNTTRRKRTGAAILAVVVLLSAVCASLVACGGSRQVNDSLTIFAPTPDIVAKIVTPIRRFQSNFPEVKVNIVELPDGYPRFDVYDRIPSSTEEFEQALSNQLKMYENYLKTVNDTYDSLRTELITGSGPDIILFDENVFPDIYKTMLSGAFADMNPLMEADESFVREEYTSLAFDAGSCEGKQYVMPLFYDFDTMISYKSVLTEVGFDTAQLCDYLSFSTEVAQCANTANERGLQLLFNTNFPKKWLRQGGIEAVDYIERKVNLNTLEFRTLQESLYALYQAEQVGASLPVSDLRCYPLKFRDTLLNDEIVFGQQSGLFDTAYLASELEYQNKQPICTPIRAANGKIQAHALLSAGISASSPNQKNAYEFLKLLLDDEFQMGDQYHKNISLLSTPINGIPVKTLNLQDRYSWIDNAVYEGFDSAYIKDWVNEIDSVVFPTNLDEKINDWFLPFYKGEAPYEECLKRAQEQLTIYITE